MKTRRRRGRARDRTRTSAVYVYMTSTGRTHIPISVPVPGGVRARPRRFSGLGVARVDGGFFAPIHRGHAGARAFADTAGTRRAATCFALNVARRLTSGNGARVGDPRVRVRPRTRRRVVRSSGLLREASATGTRRRLCARRSTRPSGRPRRPTRHRASGRACVAPGARVVSARRLARLRGAALAQRLADARASAPRTWTSSSRRPGRGSRRTPSPPSSFLRANDNPLVRRGTSTVSTSARFPWTASRSPRRRRGRPLPSWTPAYEPTSSSRRRSSRPRRFRRSLPEYFKPPPIATGLRRPRDARRRARRRPNGRGRPGRRGVPRARRAARAPGRLGRRAARSSRSPPRALAAGDPRRSSSSRSASPAGNPLARTTRRTRSRHNRRARRRRGWKRSTRELLRTHPANSPSSPSRRRDRRRRVPVEGRDRVWTRGRPARAVRAHADGAGRVRHPGRRVLRRRRHVAGARRRRRRRVRRRSEAAPPSRLKAALLAAATDATARDDAGDVFLPHTTAAVLRVPAVPSTTGRTSRGVSY